MNRRTDGKGRSEERRAAIGRELRALLKLALPLVGAQAGAQLMSLVDTAMVGRLGASSMGGVGIANGLYFAITLLGAGCVVGMDPLVTQAIGAGEEIRARQLLDAGIRVALWVSVPLALLAVASTLLLEPAGVDAETAREARRFILARAPNTLPFLVFFAQRSYLQARGATLPLLAAMGLANLGNFIGNALLIYGDDALSTVGLPRIGLPALGVVGSGLSSTIAALVSMAVLGFAIRSLHADAPPRPPRDARLQTAIIRLGLPLGLQWLAEVGVFALVGILAGRMSAQAAAGHQVALNLASMSFTMALGIGSATAVRVGANVGRGDTEGARRSGFVGLLAGAGIMSISATAFLTLPHWLGRMLTNDPSVIAAAAPLIMIAAAFQLSDGTQVVAAGALRGAGDTRASLLANLVGHYLVGLPVAIALGFGLSLGAPGLWWGLSVGLTAVALGLTARFSALSKREIKRV